MKNIRKIVAATDFSTHAENAVARAGAIAAEQGGSLEILHVVSPTALEQRYPIRGIPQDWPTRILPDARLRLDQLRTRLGFLASDAVTTSVRVGVARTVIQDACKSAHLLVLGVQGTNPVRDLLMGTTAERILRKARVPVLITKQSPAGPYRRVVVPVDFSKQSQAAVETAELIAPGAMITVLHAFDVLFEGHLKLAGAADEAIQECRTHAQQEASEQLETLLRAIGGDTSRWDRLLRQGDPTPVILDAERLVRADLVVIAKQGRSLLEEALIGSVARRTLANTQCDVLVMPAVR